MTFQDFKDKIFALAKREGVETQISSVKEKEFSLRFHNDQLDQYTDADKITVTVTVLKGGKKGSVVTEKLDDPEKVFYDALENISLVDSTDIEYFYDGKGEHKQFQTYYGKFEALEVTEKFNRAKLVYEETKKDPRIVMVPMIVYQDTVYELSIANTLGLNVSSKSDGGGMYAMALAADKSPRSGFGLQFGNVPEDVDPVKVGEEAREEALRLIGSVSIKSGKYRAILRNDAFSTLLSMFVPMINADNAYKNLSPLKGKLNEKIASDCVTFIDTPYYYGSLNNRPFDSEGVPTREKAIIENGVFKTFLHNLKTARRENVEPTGNASGSGIAPINLMVKPGEKSFEEICKELEDGIIIIDLEGIHAGANSISGDFSLGAKGLKVENGKVVHGVEQITISGNFLQLLKNIEMVGNDIRVLFGAITPSVLLKEIDIAGNV